MKKKTFKWADAFYKRPCYSWDEQIVARLKEYEGLDCFYAEVEKQIDDDIYPWGRFLVLECVLSAAVISKNKRDMRECKNGLKDLNELQKKIAKASEGLAALLDERARLMNPRFETSKAKTAPIELYRKAGSYMRPAERRIEFKRDMLPLFNNYLIALWQGIAEPTLAEMLRTLSEQMEENAVEPAHSLQRKLLKHRKATPLADFLRCFNSMLGWHCSQGNEDHVVEGDLPCDFKLSLQAITAITGAVLDIDGSGGTTEGAVQKALARMRTVRL